jgi:transketolase
MTTNIQFDGSTDLAFTEDRGKRFEAYGWFVQHINGHAHEEIINAINKAREEQKRPSIIMAKTIIGYGSPNRSGKSKVHGEPLGAEEIALTRKVFDWPEETFHIPADVLSHYRESVKNGEKAEKNWQNMMEKYDSEYKDLSAQFKDWMSGTLPEGWKEGLPEFKEGVSLATRASSGKVTNVLAKKVGNILGGSADLHPSNNTYLEGFAPLKKGDFLGRKHTFRHKGNMAWGVYNDRYGPKRWYYPLWRHIPCIFRLYERFYKTGCHYGYSGNLCIYP